MPLPRVEVPAPPVTPLPYGLLSAALVTDDLTGHTVAGIEYQPAFCGRVYDAAGACEDPVDFGTMSISVDNTRKATLTLGGSVPETTENWAIEWGDPSHTTSMDSTPSGAQFTYPAAGTYTVTLTDGDGLGYLGVAHITVAASAASGPFAGTVAFSKVATEDIPLAYGDPFVLYHLFKCSPVGTDVAARAREAFATAEGFGIERLAARYFANHADAVDITPGGTAMHPVDAVALLEQYAGSNYGGVPVLHTPKGVTTLLGSYNAVSRQGQRLETLQGSRVAAGAGYDLLGAPGSGDVAAAGQAWVYVTGGVTVRRGAQIDVGPVMPLSPALNLATALVERPSVVATECLVAAVKVSTAYGIPAL